MPCGGYNRYWSTSLRHTDSVRGESSLLSCLSITHMCRSCHIPSLPETGIVARLIAGFGMTSLLTPHVVILPHDHSPIDQTLQQITTRLIFILFIIKITPVLISLAYLPAPYVCAPDHQTYPNGVSSNILVENVDFSC